MVDRAPPSGGALREIRRLAGPSATIESVVALEGGQHAGTWQVQTATPALTAVVRQFPPGDLAAAGEQRVLHTLDGLGGLAPLLLGSDLDGRWSASPTVIISWLDGHADITPTDPHAWATQLGQALARVHAMPTDRLSGLPSVFDRSRGSPEVLEGPLATHVRSRWSQFTVPPDVLTHSDYWSGNVVWRDGVLTGVVDWSGGARGPRGFDLGWCRLDLYILYGLQIADVFLAAYEDASGYPVCDVALWDSWALARSYHAVETWTPNYQPLGRADLDGARLRRLHSQWTRHLQES